MPAETCRLCLLDKNLTSIFDLKDSVSIATKVMTLSKVKIHPDDGLPNLICSKCIEILDTCLSFIRLCEISDITLRSCSTQTEVQQKVVPKKRKRQLAKNKDDSVKTVKSDDNCEKQFSDHSLDEVNAVSVLQENRIQGEIQQQSIDHESKKAKTSTSRNRKQQCFTCGKVMSSKFRLKTHMRTHTGERPYQCSFCNKDFTMEEILKVHLRVHTGEKPLSCNICKETFAQSAGLIVHRRKHTGQTPYKCKLCPRSFRTIGHLQYHIRQHTGEKNFECDICGRDFITRSDLKQHLISHLGTKQHVCCFCGVQLTRASQLTKHIQDTHNSNKPFECTVCLSKFNQQGDLDRHMKKHADIPND